MIFGDDFYIDEDGRVIFFSRGYVKNLQHAMLYGGWTPLQDACFWRRELYERIGGMNRGLKYAADFELFLRMTLHGTCRYVPVTFSAFRRHLGQNRSLEWMPIKANALRFVAVSWLMYQDPPSGNPFDSCGILWRFDGESM